jgi:MSHA biogenesis protein MshI
MNTTAQRQEINLYQEHLRPKLDLLSAPAAVSILGVVVALMILLALFDVWQNQRLQKDIVVMQQNIENLKRQVAEIVAAFPVSQSAKFAQEIQSLNDQVKRRKKLLKLLDVQNIGNAKGFSEHMQLLARNSTRYVSLTDFGFNLGGQQVLLAGVTNQAESVPAYIQSLQAENVFSRSVFGPLVIRKNKLDDQVVDSSLLYFSLNQQLIEGVE